MFTHNLEDRKLSLDREGKTLQKFTYRSPKIYQSTPLFWFGFRNDEIFYLRTVIQRTIVASPALWNTVW